MKNVGRIVRIVGAVVDCEFAADSIPAIYNALTVDADTPVGHISTVLEVQMHLEGNMVRTVAMTSTDGLQRGTEVVDTGAPIQMPVGDETLGRIWNVIGQPVDGKPMPKIEQTYPIHRPAPAFDEPACQFTTGNPLAQLSSSPLILYTSKSGLSSLSMYGKG